MSIVAAYQSPHEIFYLRAFESVGPREPPKENGLPVNSTTLSYEYSGSFASF